MQRPCQIFLGVGANIAGSWGRPEETLRRLPLELRRLGLTVEQRSAIYATAPMGPEQPDYLNGVLGVRAIASPIVLFNMVKSLEWEAGRRASDRWTARALDIDIVDFGGLVGRFGTADQLVLPHPGVARRDFVLRPLADVAPSWRHPVSGRSVHALLQALRRDERFVIAKRTGIWRAHR